MSVRVDSPKLQVILHKILRNQNGKSERYQGAHQSFDLAPWLTEDSAVTITRTINAPAGTFQISLSDRPIVHGSTIDSLYGVVEPMDIVEIRMARRPDEYSDKLPLVFRGIVSTIARDESIGQDGKPRRHVAIGGHDWGKFFNMIQWRFYKGSTLWADWLSSWHMQTIHGIQYQVMTAGETVQSLIDNVANKFIDQMADSGVVGGAIPKFTVDVSDADPVDKVYPQGFQGKPGGTLWEFLHTFGDVGPLYELFIEDEEDAPKVVYRKPPFVTADGKTVYKKPPDALVIDPVSITRIASSKTDADIANWFWITHRRFDAGVSGQLLTWFEMDAADSDPFIDTPNCDRSLYGNRFLEIGSNHGFMTPAPNEAQYRQDVTDFKAYSRAKRLALQAANRDNVVFENGTMTMAGNEKVKVGINLMLNRGGEVSSYYVNSVTHTFMPFRSFTTTVQYTRGTGFVVRSSGAYAAAEHPYLAEIGRGPYESDRA